MEKSMISLCLLGGLAIGNGFAQTPSRYMSFRMLCRYSVARTRRDLFLIFLLRISHSDNHMLSCFPFVLTLFLISRADALKIIVL